MRTKLEKRHRIRLDQVQDDLIVVRPGFIHDFGDAFHHQSMMRTVARNEDGEYVPYTGPSDWRFESHEILDYYIFYPINKYLLKRFQDIGKDDTFFFLRTILGFFWGLNCNFPPKDIVLYTVWRLHGAPAVQVLKRKGSQWVSI